MSDPHDCTHVTDHAARPHADEAVQVEANIVGAERRRLDDDIAAAKRRGAASRQRIEAAEADIREALRAELSASRDALAAIERQHEVTVAMIRSAAQAEVERILANARQAVSGSDLRLDHSHQNDSRQDGFSNAE